MKHLILATLITILGVRCYAGVFGEDPRTYPALIAHPNGITGSGCLLRLSNSVYLVTAKHVLFKKAEGTNSPSLLSSMTFVRAYSRVGTTNVSERTMQIDLARLLNAGEIRYSTNRDVALVRVEQCQTNDQNIVHLLPGVEIVSDAKGLQVHGPDFVCQIKDVDVGGDVYMFGYPVSLTGQIASLFDPSEPLLRRGTVAGVNLARRTVIIDCPSYFGNSGGPVVLVDHPALNATRYRIIGLVSGFVPFQEEWENKTMGYSHVLKSNSGYTVVEPIDIALEMVWQ